ncbi:MAG: four helix bundle protein [Chloroflexi bacterium]|nr:four helix bundle protein [Chloroflexota bacterium]
MSDFTELDVWKKAHGLVLEIYKLTAGFPREERFRLTDQLCRSASSIPANIAEGKGRKSRKEYVQFLYTARGSLEETRYHLILARDLDYLAPAHSTELLERYDEVGRMLNGLINSLKGRTPDA